ncbi:MAG: PQQ-binding-like beta-propeller repeat protein [Alphaproteobacteria bacterium]|nr:PQQ-binding-like beta-propeller repeat protein [Alphaproteobacteria bacterium]
MATRFTAARGRFGASAILACVSALALVACQTEKPADKIAEAPAAAPAAQAPTAAPPSTPVSAASPDAAGEALYQANCAACHDHSDTTRAPSKDQLRAMSLQFLNYTLTSGKMKVQGSKLTAEERGTLVNYLANNPAFGPSNKTPANWADDFMCPADRRAVNLNAQVVSAGFGFDKDNTRALTAKQAGLTKAQLSDMDLAWSIGFPDIAEMRAQGAVVGTTLFFPVAATGQMYAIDLAGSKPCFKWVYTAPGGAPLRTSAAYGTRADGTPMLVFSGLDSTVHAVDPKTGKAFWTKSVGAYSYSMTTGTPVVLKDRVIVPVAQFEIAAAGDDKVLCCTNHGYVLSLDPRTGEQQWRYDTMPDAKQVRDRPDGKPYFGPSGAPIWNSPVIDEKRGLIYFGTGEANSEPTHKNTDALIAIGLKDGKEKWSFQATGRDIFVYGCPVPTPANRQNCSSDTVYRDVDFGASLILGKLKSGKELVFAGQKSGAAWALEPETGKVVWHTPIGTGSPLGGVHWGIAYANDTLYVPIANIGRPLPGQPPIDPSLKPGLYALDAATGKIKWMYSPAPPQGAPAGPRGARNAAFSTAPAVIDGTVVAGALDGSLYVIDAKDGKLLWSYQTAKSYETANGIPGKGGSIDANAITAANGLLLVTSGYGQFGELPGNVLLAFKPKGK